MAYLSIDHSGFQNVSSEYQTLTALKELRT